MYESSYGLWLIVKKHTKNYGQWPTVKNASINCFPMIDLHLYATSLMQTIKQQKQNLYNFNRQSCVDSKIPEEIFFTTPFVSIDLVSPLINGLNSTKITGLSGIGPRLLKLANNV